MFFLAHPDASLEVRLNAPTTSRKVPMHTPFSSSWSSTKLTTKRSAVSTDLPNLSSVFKRNDVRLMIIFHFRVTLLPWLGDENDLCFQPLPGCIPKGYAAPQYPRQQSYNLLQALLQQHWDDFIHARCFSGLKGHDSFFDPLRRDHLPCCAPISLSTSPRGVSLAAPVRLKSGKLVSSSICRVSSGGLVKLPPAFLISLSSSFRAPARTLMTLAVSLMVLHSEHHFLQESRFTSLMRFL